MLTPAYEVDLLDGEEFSSAYFPLERARATSPSYIEQSRFDSTFWQFKNSECIAYGAEGTLPREDTSAIPHPFSSQCPRLPICDITSTKPSIHLRPRPRPFKSILKRKAAARETSSQPSKQHVSFQGLFIGPMNPITPRMGRYTPVSGVPHKIFHRILRRARNKVMNAAAKHGVPSTWIDDEFWKGDRIQMSLPEELMCTRGLAERRLRRDENEDIDWRGRHMREWIRQCFRQQKLRDMSRRAAELDVDGDRDFTVGENYSITRTNYEDSSTNSIHSARPRTPIPAENGCDNSRLTTTHTRPQWWIQRKKSPGTEPPKEYVSSTTSGSKFLHPLQIRRMQLFMLRWLSPSGLPLASFDMATLSANDGHMKRRKRPPISINLYGKRIFPRHNCPPASRTPPLMLAFVKRCRKRAREKKAVTWTGHRSLVRRISNLSKVLSSA